jgi:starch-binding outer membrane protein, SusD/RagB family
MYLIRAEARGEQNDIVGALADINLVRARQFDPDEPVAGASTAEIRTLVLNERLFELAGEAKRRQDLIRHGRYTAFRRICSASIPDCEKPARGDHIILMPIPQTQLANNPLLTQNPGY